MNADGARILLVDDNREIREEATEYLVRRGYEVIAASSGAEALAALEGDRHLDLLFTDVFMPGQLDGRALAEKAIEMRPGLKVLLTSGALDGHSAVAAGREVALQFIAKPYRMKELAANIEEMLKALS